ncbi:hypothetical protein HNR00_003727 [Methylorubrum rhodinum]|uniref:Potassium channel domain-containing protein n=1 Tax=Methylorubrum rhodinum TaxID=29428 RepID=A0A840ZLT7_9HYPH|nr:two pore domain potassium channel family protein [Methylorubrum rhodinum]MBB5758999.1 hypothetical protein [Methylorubrum rhodinum]
MPVVLAASVVLVVVTILVLYETLWLTSEHLAELPVPPRARIIAVVLAAFAGHTVAVWTYAGAYWLLVLKLGLGAFSGVPVESFEDCLFVSVVAYTSLGYGDHIPLGHARLLTGVEALNGLVLIGWSASFTYLAMERYWPLHGKARARPAATARRSATARKRLAQPVAEARQDEGFALDQGPAGSG